MTSVVVLITGVTQGGLGGETARVLAPYAGLLILVGRSLDKYVHLLRFFGQDPKSSAFRLQEISRVIKEETPTANIQTVLIDLGSLQSIRTGAAEITHPIHV